MKAETRATEPEELDDVEPDEDGGADQPCPEHYPHGWKGVPVHHDGVGCEHGSWTRPES